MVKGSNYGKSPKALRCAIQKGNLRDYSSGRDGDRRGLLGAPASQTNGGALAQEIRARPAAEQAIGQGENLGEGNPEALRQDWTALCGERSFKKIPRDASTAEKRRFIGNHWKEFGSVSKACKRVGLSPSSYYYQPKIDPIERASKDADLRDRIEMIQEQYPMYGVRRVYWEFLWTYHKRINRKRISRVMKKYGLKALIYKGFRGCTTDSKHNKRIYPNLLSSMEVSRPNQVWAADITYVRIKTGFVFLAAILDLFSRKVIGWALSKKINTRLCLEALAMAIADRNPAPGCTHHADRGVQYASEEYVEMLMEHNFEISMSRKGNCWDNAFVESFFGSLKREEVHLCDYEDINDVIERLPKFIEDLYNKKRRHSSLGGLSPDEFEAKWKSRELEKLGIPSVIKLWDGLSN